MDTDFITFCEKMIVETEGYAREIWEALLAAEYRKGQ
jgi:hypothetical protein